MPTRAKHQNERTDRDRQHKPTHQANKTKQKTRPTRRGGSHEKQKDNGNEAGKPIQTRKGARGEEGRRRPAGKEREDAREGSRGRREKTAQTKKAGACSFSGVLRGVWITQGRIPQCRARGT